MKSSESLKACLLQSKHVLYERISSRINDDNGLVMRLFGILVFVVDGPVMTAFLLEGHGCGGLGRLL